MSSRKIDTIVIGSGISGLTVAGLLAKNGRRVVIVERNRKPGGALRRFTRDGIPFDIGFHYTGGLGRGQILDVLWRYLGVRPEITPVPMHPDGYDYFRFRASGTEVRAYYSYERAGEQMCAVFPDEAAGIARYLGTIKNICGKIPFYDLDLPLSPFLRDFFSSQDRPLPEAIASMVKNPELQAVLAAPAFLYGVPPAKAGLTMHAAVAHSYYQGAWGIRGGGQAVVDGFLKTLTGHGVEILTGQGVEKIEVGNGCINGVTLADRRRIPAGQVIYTGHPAHLPDLVTPGSFRPAFTHRIKGLEDTISMFTVFGRMNRPAALPALDRANLYCINRGFDLMADPAAVGNGSVLLTAPGRRDLNAFDDDRRSGDGVILMRPANWSETARFSRENSRTRGAGYREWKTAATKNLIERAAAGFGEGCLGIEPLAAGSPLTFRDELGSPAGGIYGVQHNLQQFVARARTKVQGLYLSGQGSLMTGLLGASMAGLVTAGEIMGLEETWDKVRKWQ
ncbi:MAG: NAD(P)/FAD-dependent oxidoreductase [Desulfurivibrionaceae bacterium]|nr:NAD(P)/FAD-dependent oxidoreductase [Desulfobulbales bacterium]MDT8334631.1 NAD(P)/FAD-dependent oxidoreductase [Desulfurivibrionaceae bacterium]